MAAQKAKLGVVISEKKTRRDGQEYVSTYIGLGQRSSNPKYNTSVEIIVRDGTGNIIGRQTDGFIEVSNPRTKPDELLAAKLIDESQHAKMTDAAERIPAKIKQELFIKLN